MKLPQPTPRRDYRLKLIEATRGNQSMLGCIVLAAIGKEPENPPYFRGKAEITDRGDVLCDFVEKDGTYHAKARISDDEDLARNLVMLTVHADLNEQERTEFLARVNNWIVVDGRSKSRIMRVMMS
jgi:hypothetical protein